MTAWLERPDVLDVLATAELTVEGRLRDASNATLRCRAELDVGPEAEPQELLCVVKPVAGERPLWDFPDWTITRRELAAHALSEALGWAIVPPTVWREDGPGGAGMCQLWIDERPSRRPVDVVRPARVPPGWRRVLDAQDGTGEPLVLAHADDPRLARMAVFDAIANNADRKAGHVIVDADDRLWGIDHGVTFAVEDKLRTVLWGWAGERIADDVLNDLSEFARALRTGFDPVDRWLDEDERAALRDRVTVILATGTHPVPTGRWPAIPWPVF